MANKNTEPDDDNDKRSAFPVTSKWRAQLWQGLRVKQGLLFVLPRVNGGGF